MDKKKSINIDNRGADDGSLSFFSKISTKLIVFALSLSLIPLFGFGFFSFNEYRQSLENQILEDLVLVAESKEGEVFVYLEGLKSRTVDFSSDGFIRDATKYIIENTESGGMVADLGTHLRVNKKSLDNTLQGINIISLDGKVIASTYDDEIGKDESDDDYFNKAVALSYGNALINDFSVSHHFGLEQSTISVSSLLTDKISGETIGVLVNYFDTHLIDDLLIGDYQVSLGALTGGKGQRETVDVYLVNSDKLMISSSRFFGKDVFLKQSVDTEPVNDCLSADTDKEISGMWLDYRDIPVFGASMCLVNYFDWTLVVEIDESEVLLPVFNLRNLMVLVALALMVIIMTVGLYFTKYITLPIKDLSDSTRKISKGDYDLEVRVESQDEFGLLARNFNAMVWAIKNSRKEIENNVIVITEQKNKLEEQQKAVLNILDDVEEAKNRAEEARAKNEAIIASVGEGLVFVDAGVKIVLTNKAAQNMLGLQDKDLLGKIWTMVVSPKDKDGKLIPVEKLPVTKALLTGQSTLTSIVDAYTYTRKDKTIFPVVISVSPVVIRNKTVGAVIAFRDATKEREIDKAKTEFVSLASHQLRTPLSAVNWYTEMLLSGDAGKITKDQSKYLNEIYRGSKRMVDLVNALLNVSRLELGTFIIEPALADITKIAEIAVNELTPQTKEKKIVFTKEYDEKLPEISLDKKLVHIIFQNLLSNAVKYTPDSGKVDLKITKTVKDVVITVTDTGVGIPKNQQKMIFTKLFRAGNVREMDTDGTGLGMYIVKLVLDHSGGSVSFKSTENKGTTFRVTIPLSGMKKKRGTKVLG